MLKSLRQLWRPPERPAAEPVADAAAGHEGLALHRFANFLVLGGDSEAVRGVDELLMRSPLLPWRPAEEVEREVVLTALRQSSLRVEGLTLEDVLRACELVEARHLIDNATIARHFRNMWSASSAYCKAYLRGLLALKPGEGAAARAGASFREGFSLARMVLPPYRVLQGSYRYAGRTWCARNWGTPEDARLLGRRLEPFGPRAARALYEFETIDGVPAGALRRLIERHPALALACVSVDNDNGLRVLTRAAPGGGVEVTEIEPLSPARRPYGGSDFLASRDLALEQVAGALSPA